jgi:hypothetical protein
LMGQSSRVPAFESGALESIDKAWQENFTEGAFLYRLFLAHVVATRETIETRLIAN